MAQISVEELFRGEGGGVKYGCSGIMGAVAKEIVERGVPDDYDLQTWVVLIVKCTLAAAEQMKNEGDFVPIQSRPLAMRRCDMKILEDLWYGNIDPQGRSIKKGSEIERALSLVVKHDDALCKMLTDEQKEQYEKLHDVQNKLSCLLEQEAFAEGFCLAVKIMVEVMNTMEHPSPDD